MIQLLSAKYVLRPSRQRHSAGGIQGILLPFLSFMSLRCQVREFVFLDDFLSLGKNNVQNLCFSFEFRYLNVNTVRNSCFSLNFDLLVQRL
jgi:hypothetical protein